MQKEEPNIIVSMGRLHSLEMIEKILRLIPPNGKPLTREDLLKAIEDYKPILQKEMELAKIDFLKTKKKSDKEFDKLMSRVKALQKDIESTLEKIEHSNHKDSIKDVKTE